MKHKFTLSSLLLLMAIVGFSFVYPSTHVKAMPLGTSLPNLTLETLNGGEESLQNIQEETALIITFASWCGSCRAEHPFLMELQKEGVTMYGLAWLDKPEKTKRFINELGNPFKRIYIDPTSKKTRPLNITGTPETLVVKNGTVVYKHIGPIDRDIWKKKIKPIL